MVKEQKHGKKKHQRDQANEMGAKQRPFGIPGHLCQAAVSSSPLKHVCKDPVMGYETMLKHKAFPIGLESTAILWYSFSFVHVEHLSANGTLFLGQAIYGAGLYPQKIVWARHHFSKKDALDHAHIPHQPCFVRPLCSGCTLSICLPVAVLPSLRGSGVLVSGLFVHAADKGTGVVAAAGAGLAGAHSRCIGALTSGVSRLGQCRAVFCSPQDPYFWWKC